MVESDDTAVASLFNSPVLLLICSRSSRAPLNCCIKIGLPGVVPTCKRVLMAATASW